MYNHSSDKTLDACKLKKEDLEKAYVRFLGVAADATYTKKFSEIVEIIESYMQSGLPTRAKAFVIAGFLTGYYKLEAFGTKKTDKEAVKDAMKKSEKIVSTTPPDVNHQKNKEGNVPKTKKKWRNKKKKH